MTPTHQRGFTLIELLVAIGILALMAGLSWRGLDGMSRAQTQHCRRPDLGERYLSHVLLARPQGWAVSCGPHLPRLMSLAQAVCVLSRLYI